MADSFNPNENKSFLGKIASAFSKEDPNRKLVDNNIAWLKKQNISLAEDPDEFGGPPQHAPTPQEIHQQQVQNIADRGIGTTAENMQQADDIAHMRNVNNTFNYQQTPRPEQQPVDPQPWLNDLAAKNNLSADDVARIRQQGLSYEDTQALISMRHAADVLRRENQAKQSEATQPVIDTPSAVVSVPDRLPVPTQPAGADLNAPQSELSKVHTDETALIIDKAINNKHLVEEESVIGGKESSTKVHKGRIEIISGTIVDVQVHNTTKVEDMPVVEVTDENDSKREVKLRTEVWFMLGDKIGNPARKFSLSEEDSGEGRWYISRATLESFDDIGKIKKWKLDGYNLASDAEIADFQSQLKQVKGNTPNTATQAAAA